MYEIAFQGPITIIDELQAELLAENLNSDVFTSEGFDGVSIATLLIEFIGEISPSVAVIIAAAIATKKQVVVKVDGMEVHANSNEEAVKLITDLSQKNRE